MAPQSEEEGAATRSGIRVGIDVGGTFTDFVLVDPARDLSLMYKEPSTPEDPARAVSSGLLAITEAAGVKPADVQIISHGTTIGLNAIIQRKGARTALVTSRGSRDILEIGRGKMTDPFNFFERKETPLVSRADIIETGLRLDAEGRPTEVDASEIEAIARRLGEIGAETCAVTLINSYLAPEVEDAFARELSRAAGIDIWPSSAIWPEVREYERCVVAVMNAYIAPLMRGYFGRIEDSLAANGFTGRLLISTSNGGTLTVETARQRPIDTVLSGPAAGVVAARRFTLAAGFPLAVTVDMGGTSSDMSVLDEGGVEYSTRAKVGDFPLFTPVVSVSAIGAGGGSIVKVDEFGVLKVGPESAGANPGPVCYGRGGTQPTVTDCYLVCGYISADAKLGGSISLSLADAREALSAIASQMGMDGDDAPEKAAWAAISIATAKMATELRKGLAERGIDQNGYSLVPFGGAGPTHGGLLAQEAKIGRIVIPDVPGAFCALGALGSDLKRDFARAIRRINDAGGETARHIAEAAAQLRREADVWLAPEAGLVTGSRSELAAQMKYKGQSYEITVALPGAELEAGEIDRLFHAEHRKRYGFEDRSSRVVVTSLRLTVIGELVHADRRGTDAAATAAPPGSRPAFFDGKWHDTAVVERAGLRAGDALAGPVIINQPDTTIVFPAGWQVLVDASGAITATQGKA